MDTFNIITVSAGVLVVLLVQITRAIGAFRLRLLTVSLAEMVKSTSQENERKEIETKMHSLVKHMRSDSFVDTSKSHSRLHLYLIVAGSYAVLFGIVLVGLVAVYAMIDVSASLVIDSLVFMYIGSGRFYLDMVNNYIILVLLILYLSAVLWPIVYIHNRLCVAKSVLKHEKDIPEPGPIDRYGLTFSGIAPVLCLLLFALIVHFVNYGMDLARYEEQVSASLDDGSLDTDIDRRLSEGSFTDDFQRKLFIGVLFGRILEESVVDRRASVGDVICDEFGLRDDDVAYFLSMGFRERVSNADLSCLSGGLGAPGLGDVGGLFSIGEEYWRGISTIPPNADPLGLGIPGRAVVVEEDEARWFYFIAFRDGFHTFSAEGSFDSVMALYSSEAGELNFMEFNDDRSGTDPSISIELDAGVTYYVGIAGFLGGSGRVNVTVEAGGLFGVL